jgi:predicted  nucleic acid-binding Zn-ribbon protein
MVVCLKCGDVQEGPMLSVCKCGSNSFQVTWNMTANMVVTTGASVQPMPQAPRDADEPIVTPDQAIDLEVWFQQGSLQT